jgi:hypothetical protein
MRLSSMVRGGGGTRALTHKEVDEAMIRALAPGIDDRSTM